eukprot:scaffold16.g105.t1
MLQPAVKAEYYAMAESTSSGPSSSTAERGAAALSAVPGCTTDMSAAKNYYKRYRICLGHLNQKSVELNGQACRFCQACGSFHSCDAFEGDKKSCARKLKRHNERRSALKAARRAPRPAATKAQRSTAATGAAAAPSCSPKAAPAQLAVLPALGAALGAWTAVPAALAGQPGQCGMAELPGPSQQAGSGTALPALAARPPVRLPGLPAPGAAGPPCMAPAVLLAAHQQLRHQLWQQREQARLAQVAAAPQSSGGTGDPPGTPSHGAPGTPCHDRPSPHGAQLRSALRSPEAQPAPRPDVHQQLQELLQQQVRAAQQAQPSAAFGSLPSMASAASQSDTLRTSLPVAALGPAPLPGTWVPDNGALSAAEAPDARGPAPAAALPARAGGDGGAALPLGWTEPWAAATEPSWDDLYIDTPGDAFPSASRLGGGAKPMACCPACGGTGFLL